jgi:hypothetical protein
MSRRRNRRLPCPERGPDFARRLADHFQRADHCALMQAAGQERDLVRAGHEAASVPRRKQHIEQQRGIALRRFTHRPPRPPAESGSG